MNEPPCPTGSRSEIQTGHYPQAIADNLVDARRKDLGAQHAAGRILLWGKPGVPADLREAARWIAEASYLGESEARGVLRSRADLLALVGKQPVRALGALAASQSASGLVGAVADAVIRR